MRPRRRTPGTSPSAIAAYVFRSIRIDRMYVDKLCREQHRPGLEVALRLEN
jgi:hypothetical protein